MVDKRKKMQCGSVETVACSAKEGVFWPEESFPPHSTVLAGFFFHPQWFYCFMNRVAVFRRRYRHPNQRKPSTVSWRCLATATRIITVPKQD